jgi:hypothetical protein
MPGFDMVKYLKSKMSTQAPQPNRPRSNAPRLQAAEAARQDFAEWQVAPTTASQREAGKRQWLRMGSACGEIRTLHLLLSLAAQRAKNKGDAGNRQLMKKAIMDCEFLCGRILRERALVDANNVNEARMQFREEMMQNVIQKLSGMANVVNTAGKLVPAEDLTETVKYMESSRGYFDRSLMRTLGLVRPSKFAEPFGA